MKINNGYNQYVNNNLRYNKEATQNKKIQDQPQKVNEEAVKVDISDAAKQVAEANNNVAFSEKVQAIKQAVLNGTYEVSSEKIADKMTAEMSQQRKGIE
ncbi:flagellar biosynthesis anti-sigma factor FlgM [Desemzia sp. RIT804]|uniref:flagellar biosynthesis anti-sigma factor FlgM n=1 Tax=Desemzia sp. RIT 804 TaxID=2810209 RepID=UPI00194DB86C|nr:flagellar biosynthesis anti-sigma factor FlgM [Desemzia sp. RIT 804]MBM6614714.1 flagellar biosynthesis anti-sigma factor FlgM [Desemzia sp. RIT 804]